MLECLNSDAMAAKRVACYYALVPYGDPYDYAAPDLLAAWYPRNIRIYHNIVKLIPSPNDRILVSTAPVTSDGYSKTRPMTRP